MKIHHIFLLLWKVELTLIPILALLDFGFSTGLDSNFFARFGYLAAFGIAIFYLFSRRKGLPAHPIIAIFFTMLIVGVTKGIFENNFNSAFFSHVYYVIMPLVMCAYGWHFMDDYARSDSLQRKFSKLFRFAFYIGLIVVILFQVAYRSGLANYDAMGIWNFFLSGPYLLQQANGLLLFITSLLFTLLAGKRGILVVFLVYLAIMVYLSSSKNKAKLFLATPFIAMSFLIMIQDSSNVGLGRAEKTVVAIQEGDFDSASAMRWSEAASAFIYMDSRTDHWFLGTGFGSRYQPHPELPGYEDFYRHYTHFGIISYIWIGGLFAPLLIYTILLITAVSLTMHIKRGTLEKRFHFFAYWIWGIITVSMFGAVLMNNSFLWFIIGCCLKLKKRASTYPFLRKGLVGFVLPTPSPGKQI